MKTTDIIMIAIIAIIAITAFVCYIIGRHHRRPIEPLTIMLVYTNMIRKVIKWFTNHFTTRAQQRRLMIAEIINKAKYSERVYTLSDLEFIDRYGQELHDELLAAHDEQKEQLLMLEI